MQKLQMKVAELKASNAGLTEQSEKDSRRYGGEKQELQKSLDLAEKKADDMRAKYILLEQKHGLTEQNNTELKLEVEGLTPLKPKLEIALKEKDRLEDERTQLQARIEGLSEKVEKLSSESQEQAIALSKEREKSLKLESELSSLKKDYTKSHELEVVNTRLATEKEAQTLKANELGERLHREENKTQSLQKILEDLREKFSELDSCLAKTQKRAF
eukprot:TRINITY_DN3557_c0_g1_i1.p1 TRINITY_DN3557_c0_g1~~TRINITY_DN3557_c0_g1_i1.p1  ORF type:complete len:216 (+),score=51.28 TRINITY_DN3557_c0_g1_i1:531-1178(+)